MISRRSIITVAGTQVSCDLAGEAAILNLADGVYYGLDPVGATIWNLIQQPRSVEEICARVMAEYDVGAERCQSDVLALLAELHSRGLIEVRNETSA
jgi:coenzyme PQQ synthesis protein D (PqqD)